jgi:hypothetical protein
MGQYDGPDVVSISDAEEIEYSLEGIVDQHHGLALSEEQIRHQLKANIQTKIRLHQEVFPHHQLVGWYRVGDEVIPEDLLIHADFVKEYAANATVSHSTLLFVLMNSNDFYKKSNSEGRNKSQDLPIAVFEAVVTNDQQLQQQGQTENTVFVGVDFELSAGQSERIVIERIFCETLSVSFSPSEEYLIFFSLLLIALTTFRLWVTFVPSLCMCTRQRNPLKGEGDTIQSFKPFLPVFCLSIPAFQFF